MRSGQLNHEGLDQSPERGDRRPRSKRSPAVWESRVSGALAQTDPLQRMTGFLRLLASCDAESIPEVEAAWMKLKASGIELPAEEALLDYRLGQLKGAEGLGGHGESPADFAKLPSVRQRFEGWLQADPYAAEAWLDGLPAGKFRDQMALSMIVATSAAGDPEGALERVADLPEHLRQMAGRSMGERIRETGSMESASEILERLGGRSEEGHTPYLKGVLESLLNENSGANGERVTSLLESHLDQAYVDSGALAQVTAGKGRTDPASALDWAVGIEGKRADLPQGSLLSAAVGSMDLAGLDVAEEWALRHPSAPGIDAMHEDLQMRRRILEDRGDDANEYDKDD